MWICNNSLSRVRKTRGFFVLRTQNDRSLSS